MGQQLDQWWHMGVVMQNSPPVPLKTKRAAVFLLPALFYLKNNGIVGVGKKVEERYGSNSDREAPFYRSSEIQSTRKGTAAVAFDKMMCPKLNFHTFLKKIAISITVCSKSYSNSSIIGLLSG